MRFSDVLAKSRTATWRSGDAVLHYDPECGVRFLPDPLLAEPVTPRLWLGEIPPDGWRLCVDVDQEGPSGARDVGHTRPGDRVSLDE
jgi:hypothetical protein